MEHAISSSCTKEIIGYERGFSMSRITMLRKAETKTLNTAFEDFMTFCKSKKLSQATIRNYNLSFKSLSNFVAPSEPVTNIDSHFVQSYILHLQQRLDNTESINNHLRHFRAMVNYWAEMNCCQNVKVKLLRTEEKVKVVYTDTELQLLLKKPNIKECSFSEYRTWVIINFLVATGCRLRTVVNLKIKDVDFDNGLVTFQGDITKSKKPQLLPLPQSLIAILKEYLKHRKGEAEDILFCSETGTKLVETSVNHNISGYNRSRGVNRTGVHLFRHTFSKNFIMSGGDIFRLQRQLGHSTLEMSKRYANIWDKDLQVDFERYNLLERLKAPQQKIKMK
jgi:integrase/recombinase XerD